MQLGLSFRIVYVIKYYMVFGNSFEHFKITIGNSLSWEFLFISFTKFLDRQRQRQVVCNHLLKFQESVHALLLKCVQECYYICSRDTVKEISGWCSLTTPTPTVEDAPAVTETMLTCIYVDLINYIPGSRYFNCPHGHTIPPSPNYKAQPKHNTNLNTRD